MNKKWYFSKTIWIQGLGLIGSILIGAGVMGESSWALYLGIATQALGVVIRLVTKGAVIWE